MAISIRTLLQPFIKSKRESWKIALLEKWPHIVGPLVDKVAIKKIDDEQITLGVCDSCWMQELYLLSPTLLEAINKNLDRQRIKRIRFILMERKQNRKTEIQTPHQEDSKPPLHWTTMEQKALARVTDHELRTCLELFLARCYQERKK